MYAIAGRLVPPHRRLLMGLPLSRPDRLTLLLAGIALLGAGLVLARGAAYGVALHDDSVNYIATARNLLDGQGFANHQGGFYKMWPPLYPLLLAAVSLGIFDPLDVAGPLNLALFGLTIFIVGQYLRRRLAYPLLAVGAALAVALAVPLGGLAAWALSETLFILLATLALMQADRFLAGGKTAALLMAAIFSALAWQTRYIGVAVPVAVGLLLLTQPGASGPQRARRLALLIVVAALPMAAWQLRNYLVTERFLRAAMPVQQSLLTVLADVAAALARWVDFDLPRIGRLWPRAALALTALIWLPIAVRFLKERGREQTWDEWRPALIFGVFALTYLLLMVAAFQSGSILYQRLGVAERYAAPLYIPLLIAAVFALDRLLSFEGKRPLLGRLDRISLPATGFRGAKMPTLPAVILILTLALWMAGQLAATVDDIRRVNAPGQQRGYAAPPWAAATVRYLRENPLDGLVYSNLSVLAYLHNAGDAVHRKLPQSRRGDRSFDRGNAASGPEQLAAWLDTAPSGAYLVWFNHRWDNAQVYDYGPPELRAAPELAPVAELADGVIYRVRN